MNKNKLKEKILRKESEHSKKEWNRERKNNKRGMTENMGGI